MLVRPAGSQMYVGKYDPKRELFTVIGKRQTLDYSSVDGGGGYVWAAVGTNGPDPMEDTGRLLTAAWVRGGGNGRVACDEVCSSKLTAALAHSLQHTDAIYIQSIHKCVMHVCIMILILYRIVGLPVRLSGQAERGWLPVCRFTCAFDLMGF